MNHFTPKQSIKDQTPSFHESHTDKAMPSRRYYAVAFIAYFSIFLIFASNSIISTLRTKEIALPVKIAVVGISQENIAKIKVNATTYRGKTAALTQSSPAGIWTLSNDWTRRISLVIPKNITLHMDRIRVEIGDKHTDVFRSDILKLSASQDGSADIVLELPTFVRAQNSIFPKLDTLINYPGDGLLLTALSSEALTFLILFPLLVFLILFIERRVYLKLSRTTLLLIFVTLYLLVRVPFYSQQLLGEEGTFARVFYNKPLGPNYILYSRIDGQEFFGKPMHPAPIFETMALAGSLVCKLVPFMSLNDGQQTIILRFSFSLFQFVIWLIFSCIILYSMKTKDTESCLLLFLLMIATAVSPVEIGSSLQLQVDGSIGVLFIGLFGLSLFFKSAVRASAVLSNSVVFVGSFVLGLGKHDWNFILLVSMILSVFCLLLMKRFKCSYIGTLLVIGIGCLAGNCFSYAIDHANYVSGLSFLMKSMKGQTPVGMDWGSIKDFLIPLSLFRMPALITNGCLLLLLGAIVDPRRAVNEPPSTLMVIFFPVLLFLGYFMTVRDSVDLRYFSTSVLCVVLSIGAIMFSPAYRKRHDLMRKIVIILLMHSAVFSYECWKDNISVSTKGHRLPVNFWEKVPADRSCIPILASGFAHNKKEVDFIGDSMGKRYTEYVRDTYEKQICGW